MRGWKEMFLPRGDGCHGPHRLVHFVQGIVISHAKAHGAGGESAQGAVRRRRAMQPYAAQDVIFLIQAQAHIGRLPAGDRERDGSGLLGGVERAINRHPPLSRPGQRAGAG